MSARRWLWVVAVTAIGAPAAAAPPVPGGLQRIDTNCYEMGLPKSFVQTSHVRGSKPWLGRWVYEAKTLGVQVIIRCKRYQAGPFHTILTKSRSFLTKLGVTNYVRKNAKVKKDAARNVARVIGQGMYKGTKVSIDRFYRRYPKRGLTIAVAILGPLAKSAIVNNIAHTIARTFDPVDQKEIAELSKPQKRKPAPKQKGK
jgi:hypothetical protein